MGTNYYTAPEPACKCCGHAPERLHIGKSSAGWSFLFAPCPELKLTSWRAWKAYLEGREIIDEYGEGHTLEDFSALVEAKVNGRGSAEDTTDPDGYRFSTSCDFI